MASVMVSAEQHPREITRVYSVCCFDEGLVVPQVSLLEAASDDDAVESVRSMNQFKAREIWHRHRLVAAFRAQRES